MAIDITSSFDVAIIDARIRALRVITVNGRSMAFFAEDLAAIETQEQYEALILARMNQKEANA